MAEYRTFTDLDPRMCWVCEKEITFLEFHKQNLYQPREYLKKLWKHDSVKLLCCECYKVVRVVKSYDIRQRKAYIRSLEWARNGRVEKLKQLGVFER